METFDYVVIGAGIVGISIARALKFKHPSASILVLDKEERPAFHASGRNSGVIHAGFYYTANSLKAKLTLEGNRKLTSYCDERKIPIKRTGKLVVAVDESDLKGLDTLLERGRANGVPLESIDEKTALEIEPHAKTFRRAIWSPLTSSVDPTLVANSLMSEAEDLGVRFQFNTKYIGQVDGHTINTTQGQYSFGTLINAAGLYADKIAHDFETAHHYRILPFKGLYLYAPRLKNQFKTCIYPVPNLLNPFLGVHYTVSCYGDVKIGPTAIPALWREQYKGLDRFNAGEFFDIGWRQMQLVLSSSFDFKGLAWEEFKKYSRRYLVSLAGRLSSEAKEEDFTVWGKPGIRAQLLDTRTNQLEMDFKVEKVGRCVHVLNAVSPAFTCSLSFADYLCEDL